MALPCVCYKCARCKELKTLRDPFCLSVEEENCGNRQCSDCDFVCERFTEKLEGGKKSMLWSVMES